MSISIRRWAAVAAAIGLASIISHSVRASGEELEQGEEPVPIAEGVEAELDLSVLDEEGLRILVTNLMQRVRDLEDQAEYEPPDVIELRELRSQNRRLEIQIKGLRKENNDLRARLGHSRRTARAEEVLDRKTEVLNPLSQIKPVAMHTFEYEWYLIGSKGRGRFTIRYRDGSRTKGSYSYEEYYTDRIGVDVFFKNASDQPASFSMMIGAGATIRSMFRDYRNVLGKVACTTPVLQRGEVHQITATVRVPNTRKINAVGVGRVTSTSYPREE